MHVPVAILVKIEQKWDEKICASQILVYKFFFLRAYIIYNRQNVTYLST